MAKPFAIVSPPSPIINSFPPGPRVNLGCGPVQPDGWINIDGSRRARLASRLPWIDRALVKLRILSPTEFGPHITIADLTKRLPFQDDSVACIYAGEVWEHFELPDAVALTGECFRVLRPGGVLRVCVPDGPTFWHNYLGIYAAEMSRPPDMRDAEPLRAHVAMYFREIQTRPLWFGSLGHTHKWQFDEIQLVDLFKNAGFAYAERQRYHESRIPDVERVERSDFLIVEGVKIW